MSIEEKDELPDFEVITIEALEPKTILEKSPDWDGKIHPQIYYLLKIIKDHEDRIKALESME